MADEVLKVKPEAVIVRNGYMAVNYDLIDVNFVGGIMTNSFLILLEAPDFASAIAETYESVNQSYDRREKLERENDETRLKNAAMPLKMIEALAEFAPKAKKLADEIREDRYTKDIQKKSVFETPEQLERAKKLTVL